MFLDSYDWLKPASQIFQFSNAQPGPFMTRALSGEGFLDMPDICDRDALYEVLFLARGSIEFTFCTEGKAEGTERLTKVGCQAVHLKIMKY